MIKASKQDIKIDVIDRVLNSVIKKLMSGYSYNQIFLYLNMVQKETDDFIDKNKITRDATYAVYREMNGNLPIPTEEYVYIENRDLLLKKNDPSFTKVNCISTLVENILSHRSY